MRLLIPHSLLKRSFRELAKTCLWKECDVGNHKTTFPPHVKTLRVFHLPTGSTTPICFFLPTAFPRYSSEGDIVVGDSLIGVVGLGGGALIEAGGVGAGVAAAR